MIPSYHQNVGVQVEDSRYLRVEFLKALHFQIKFPVFSRSVCRFVMKKEILCTLGPKTLNKKFLNFAEDKIDLLRLNMSHIEITKLN